jgi:tetratricopeptide (TPR) repeat protein
MSFRTLRSGIRCSLAAVALVAGSLGAQAPKCEIPIQTQAKLLPASLMFNSAFKQTATPAEKAKALSSTVKALTDDVTGFPAPAQAGRHFLLAQTFLVWMDQPGIGLTEPRGKIGYTANPTGMVDLAAAIDSSFDALRVLKPECSDSLKLYTNGVWGQLINKAVTFTNSQQLDSADLYARRSMWFDSTQFYAYNIMSNIAIVKEDTAGMLEWFARTIDVTAALKDTNAVKVRDGMLQNLASLYSGIGTNATGTKADSMKKAAVATYRRYLGFYPNDLTTKLRIMRLSDTPLDSAGASRFVDEVLTSVDGVTDAQLTEAGGEMTKLKFYSSGMRLFDAALKKNAYSRDALYNTAVALNNLERFDEIRPFFAKLKEIDPNNSGIYSLARNIQSARKLAVQTRANKGVRPRAGQTIMLNPAQQAQIRVFNDSLVYYTQFIQNLHPTVDVRSFTPTADGFKFGAVVQVAPDKPAAAFNVVVEFLNAAGTVVTTQTARTKEIAAGSFDQVSVDGKGAGIVAFRYRVTR